MSRQQEQARVFGFDGPTRYLSNYFYAPITVQQITYPTNEHAFAAAKTKDVGLRAQIAAAPSPGAAKRMGRSLVLRDDWEAIKTDVMQYLVRVKFDAHPELAAKLVATGDAELIEANTWGDRIWGVDAKTGLGENRLGKALMAVRSDLQQALGIKGDTNAVNLANLPIFTPGPNEIVDRREDFTLTLDHTITVLGRSEDGTRVLGRDGGGVLSVSKDAFSIAPHLDDQVTISRVDGNDQAFTVAKDVALER